jgi:large subunit ribosomal protein L4
MAITPKKEKKVKKAASLPVRVVGQAKTSKMDCPDYLMVSVSPVLIAEALHVARSRSRIRTAHTKIREEVRGGGKKPWAQKGTGRARHASTRSPLWVGGGVTFGPRTRKERITSLSATARRRAFAAALSTHVEAGVLEVIQMPKEVPTKTKDVVKETAGKRALLVVVSQDNAAFAQAVRNLPSVRVATADQVTLEDVVWAQNVWLDEAALPVIAARSTK